jgi:hypothetical protein
MEMATAMNRSVANILFSGFGGAPAAGAGTPGGGFPGGGSRPPADDTDIDDLPF